MKDSDPGPFSKAESGSGKTARTRKNSIWGLGTKQKLGCTSRQAN